MFIDYDWLSKIIMIIVLICWGGQVRIITMEITRWIYFTIFLVAPPSHLHREYARKRGSNATREWEWHKIEQLWCMVDHLR